MGKPKYQLMPILEKAGACWEAKQWLAREKHETFFDAYEALMRTSSSPFPEIDWFDWIVMNMVVAGSRNHKRWINLPSVWNDCKEFRKAFPPAKLERIVIAYARRNKCLYKIKEAA